MPLSKVFGDLMTLELYLRLEEEHERRNLERKNRAGDLAEIPCISGHLHHSRTGLDVKQHLPPATC